MIDQRTENLAGQLKLAELLAHDIKVELRDHLRTLSLKVDGKDEVGQVHMVWSNPSAVGIHYSALTSKGKISLRDTSANLDRVSLK